ncbi:U-box domain-containing protein 29-like [Andrographis paniculata]|uniref:U-box domain-containing protein 29-like n=1 Tax=Andrographis paniculata TaxID=175694 RepID=UPI0021E896BE|nr:U-box domain-containing protein 29-like [Andrographis paniculata]
MAKEKRREELYVTVPNLFRCPISMDVMRSPVSLCTGVTYDRSSIEKWLALGHNTCPATMQTLPSTHTTPNLVLRRLIHLWLAHADLTSAPPSSSVISKKQAADIINGAFDSDSLAKLIDFMKSSEENLKFVAVSNVSVSRLVESLAKSDGIPIRERIVEILDLVSPVNGMSSKLNDLILRIGDGGSCLSSIVTVFQKGNTESKIKSAKLLETISINPESQRRIAEEPELLNELHILSTTPSVPSAAEAAMSALAAISTSRPVKKELIKLGIVGTVGKILSDDSHAVGGVIEKALKVLEAIATCTEGRSAIGEDEECTVEIVRRLMKCSGGATEHGITVLWSTCCLARDRVVQERVARVNGLTKVLLVMQSDCSASTKQMCGELVKVLRAKNTKSKLAPYETKTTHITPY